MIILRSTSRKAKISEKIDICQDVLFSPTTMEIYSDDQILIRQCFGIISYDTNEISIKAKGFSATICGKNLTMKAGGEHILYITGKILQISFLREVK